jgi:hypothetical protein
VAEAEIKALQRSREEIRAQIDALGHDLKLRSDEVKSLEEKREHHSKILRSDEESMKRKIVEELIALKTEKPELFYMTGAEQVAIIAALILKRFFTGSAS